MKVLIVGGGGREHALAWKIGGSPYADEVIVAPGNAGIRRHARCVPVADTEVEGLVSLARDEGVGLVVVGPEAPLVAGLADRLEAEGIAVFGPSAAAAEIEGSKAFAKEFMERRGIPTASARVHDALGPLLEHLEASPLPVVVKASGLAAGKGVAICRTRDEALAAGRDFMEGRIFGAAGDRVVVEEFLEGEEASFLALVDGTRVLPLAVCQDHKALLDGDRGPNTGGMGAFTPVPSVGEDLAARVTDEVLLPAVRGLAEEGRPFRGLLYAGLMFTPRGPRVLEFNARFGDPETQALMLRMGSDLLPLLAAAAHGDLGGGTVEWREGTSLCVVMAAPGYPAKARAGLPISGLDSVEAGPDLQVFHAGTREEGGRTVTAGGRVLGVTAFAPTGADARRRAYDATRRIHWEGVQFRTDIGARGMAPR
ncbi:phosphoribosylamine--glycine ligase [Myxococcota bacterium]|nr:phosphoribosylamine--glycine ligase [Myxococcota bacterium]